MDPALVDAAIDCFKRARKLVYDKDYELEAMAEAYLGNIYYKAHKNKTIARPHLYDAIRLANLVARSFTTEEWFKRATQQLAEIQEADQKEADKKQEEDDNKLKEKIKKELDECTAAKNKGLRDLLNHLNNTVLKDQKIEVNDDTFA